MKQPSFVFWQNWLFYSSLVFAGAGILFAFWGDSLLFSSYHHLLAEVFWQQAEIPDAVKPFMKFIYKPIGGTIACCYILLAYIARYPFKAKEVWARNTISLAFGCWVTIDNIGCLYAKIYPQIYFINAFSILIKALPIVFTWNQFSFKKRKYKSQSIYWSSQNHVTYTLPQSK